MDRTNTHTTTSCCPGSREVRPPEDFSQVLGSLKARIPGLFSEHRAQLRSLWSSAFVEVAQGRASLHEKGQKVVLQWHSLTCAETPTDQWNQAIAHAEAATGRRCDQLLREQWERGPVLDGHLRPTLLPRTGSRTTIVPVKEMPREVQSRTDDPKHGAVLSVAHGYFVETESASQSPTPAWLVKGCVPRGLDYDEFGTPILDSGQFADDHIDSPEWRGRIPRGFFFPHLSQAQMFAALYRQAHGDAYVHRAAHVRLHLGRGTNYILVMPFEYEKHLLLGDLAANVLDLLQHMSVSSKWYRDPSELREWDREERRRGGDPIRSLLDQMLELPPLKGQLTD